MIRSNILIVVNYSVSQRVEIYTYFRDNIFKVSFIGTELSTLSCLMKISPTQKSKTV